MGTPLPVGIPTVIALPNLNGGRNFGNANISFESWESSRLAPADRAEVPLWAEVERLDGTDLPYRYSDDFLRLCSTCKCNGFCTSKIDNPAEYYFYRIRKVHGRFRYFDPKFRGARQGLPPLFASVDDPENSDGVVNNGAKYNYDAGHLVAASFGGLDCPFNLALMNTFHNQKGYFRLMELYCASFFTTLKRQDCKSFQSGDIIVQPVYAKTGKSMIPTHFHVQVKLHRTIYSTEGGMKKAVSFHDWKSFTFSNVVCVDETRFKATKRNGEIVARQTLRNHIRSKAQGL